MKKIILCLIIFCIFSNLFSAEVILKIDFEKNKFVSKEINFISNEGYKNNSEILTILQDAKRVLISIFVPKSEIWEGTYILSIYKNNECVEKYEIVSENYVYDLINQYYLKADNILNEVRSFLYIEYLRS